MARADTTTLLPLDRFMQIVGINPLHANQVALAIENSEDTALDPANCGKVIVQQPWQADDALSREEMAIAIRQAEDNMANVLGFDVAPRWIQEEHVLGERRRGIGCGLNNLFQAQRGYILSGGIEAKTPVELEATVAYTDEDGDGYKETVTIIVTTTVSDAREIALYYPGTLADDAWEIRPIKVALDVDVNLNGFNVATITCARHQLVQPDILSSIVETLVADGLDSDDSDFLSVVDVYRHWNDPSQQGSFVWGTRVGYCGCLPPSTCVLCGDVTQPACLSVVQPRLGHVRLYPGTWNEDTLVYDTAQLSLGRSPDKAILSYRAGYTEQGRLSGMAPIFERAVTMYALSLMDRPICGCAGITAKHENARLDLSENSRESAAYGGEDLWSRSQFGFRRGAVEAWLLVERMALGR